jgi:acyl carrier protein
VAYIDADGPAPDAADLRAYLSEHVPNYMIPSAYVSVEELPLTPNGKVDRDALPEPEWDQESASEEFVAPRTASERGIADIWSKVLSVHDIGIHDNFFALGGHSLLAMKVISRVQDELGAKLTLRAIFDAPTVVELAAEVDRAKAAPAPIEPPPLVRVRRG